MRRRLWSAWQVLMGRPLSIAFQWGDGPGNVPPDYPVIPKLTPPNDPETDLLSIGTGGWLWDGKAFPFATVDDWILTISDEKMTTVRVEIAVRV